MNEMERLIEQRERELKNGKGKGLDNDIRGLIDWTTEGNHLQRPVAIHVETAGKS